MSWGLVKLNEVFYDENVLVPEVILYLTMLSDWYNDTEDELSIRE
jgi:hypothetical protein